MVTARSDPRGTNVEIDITSPRPIVTLIFDLVGDDEPPVSATSPDWRYFKGFRPKFVREGTYPIMLTAVDDRGCSNHSFGSQSITIIR